MARLDVAMRCPVQPIPRTAQEWYALAERLWANGDEQPAVFAHARGQAMEFGMPGEFGTQEIRNPESGIQFFS